MFSGIFFVCMVQLQHVSDNHKFLLCQRPSTGDKTAVWNGQVVQFIGCDRKKRDKTQPFGGVIRLLSDGKTSHKVFN